MIAAVASKIIHSFQLSNTLDVTRYLERFHYTGDLNPTREVLSELQSSHLLNVPFENLDIHNHIKINLTDSYNKIVNRRRGGFCYELNGLFYRLLKELGFRVKLVSARVFDSAKGYGPEFDHMAIIATIQRRDYLADVGFGEFTLEPLKLELDNEQADPRGVFRIETYDAQYKVVKKRNDRSEFIPEYLFSEKERLPEDFIEMCNYHQTSKDSHFTQKRICSLPTAEGRITLTGNILKITSGKSITERELKTEVEVAQVLKDYFKIVL